MSLAALVCLQTVLKSPSVAAAAMPARFVSIFAEFIFAAFNAQHLAVNQSVRQLFSCLSVNALHGGARNLHFFGAGFLRQPFQVNKPHGLILVYGHDDDFSLHAVPGVASAPTVPWAVHAVAHPSAMPRFFFNWRIAVCASHRAKAGVLGHAADSAPFFGSWHGPSLGNV